MEHGLLDHLSCRVRVTDNASGDALCHRLAAVDEDAEGILIPAPCQVYQLVVAPAAIAHDATLSCM